MIETSLAELVPLWRTLRDGGVTALVTPALDYVGALELGSLDVRFAGAEQIASLGEGLRSFIASLEDECTLHLVRVATDDSEPDIAEYEAAVAAAEPAELERYVAARAAWLREQKLRRTLVYLFFSLGGPAANPLSRGYLGTRLLYARLEKATRQAHERHLRQLSQLRDRLSARLQHLGISSRELEPQEVWDLHYRLLNPERARSRARAPRVALRDDLFSPETVRRLGPAAAEYTEAEQLTFEDLEDAEGHFRQGKVFRRVLTLKVLPEGGTSYLTAEPLLGLAAPTADGVAPFPYVLTTTIHVLPQGKARWTLNTQHGLVDALKNAIPFLADKSISKQTADAAKQASIGALFAELNEMSSKLVTLSVSLLLDADSLDQLDARTEAARAAFNLAGNSQLLPETLSQVPAFLSLFPGAGPYQLRKKGCTSRNAADFLPVFAPWRGCSKASSLLPTPTGDAFRLDLFDKKLATAFHGLVVADTGRGKSVSLGALTLDALAAGVDAILIDSGNSWKPLTEILGGIHVPVDIKTSISPFVSYGAMLDAKGEIDNEALQDVVTFLEVCTTDRGQAGYDRLQTDIVARAVRRTYERLRARPDERPLISAFRDCLASYDGGSTDDRAIAGQIARRLAIYCDGLYAEFLNRPSKLRFDARILTFDLQDVARNPATKAIAMATIIQAITNRAASRKRRTLVEVDEGHEHLGADDVGERFLAGCYRKMRKFDVGMWMISQSFDDFASAKAGPAIIGNSAIKIFLSHGGGHDAIVQRFGLSPRAAQAFKGLAMKPGYYSDLLLLYGPMVTTVRLALHPLAYWILTTDPDDRRLIDRSAEKNPDLPRFKLLEELAARYPHGAHRPAKA